jgi:DNA-binding NarL/FixJ family response regulator
MATKDPKKAAKPPARVLVVDDHPLLRDGLIRLISRDPTLVVCGEAEDPGTALKQIAALKPDVAVVDLTLKDKSGLELVKDIKVRHPRLPVLVLSMHDETLYAQHALRAGARGYIMKEEAPEKVRSAIHTVLNGGIYLSDKMTARTLDKYVSTQTPVIESPLELLTDRELEVFELIGQGLGTRRISEKLHLSVKTIESYRARIKDKLGLRDAAELVRHAIEWRLHG